jgi:hypothetical protein
VLTIPRNLDAPPYGAAEAFSSAFNTIANDGLPHELIHQSIFSAGVTLPTGLFDPTRRLYLRWMRAEWQALDIAVPPTLSLALLVNGQLGVITAVQRLFLHATEDGSPAMELRLRGEAPAGSIVTAAVTNTGVVTPQQVNLYLWGWQLPEDSRDGEGYGF